MIPQYYLLWVFTRCFLDDAVAVLFFHEVVAEASGKAVESVQCAASETDVEA